MLLKTENRCSVADVGANRSRDTWPRRPNGHTENRMGKGRDEGDRIHRMLTFTPAMAAKVTDRLFDVSDIVRLLEASESKKAA